MAIHLFTFGLMVAVSLIYGSNLGWRLVVAFWGAFLATAIVVGGVLHAALIALLLKLAIAVAMLVKGRMGSSSFS